MCSAHHATLVLEYRLARHAWELAAEHYAGATPVDVRTDTEELREYRSLHPAPTFRAWLVGTRHDRPADE